MIDIIVPVFDDNRIFRLLKSVFDSPNGNLTRFIIIEASNNRNFHEHLANTIRQKDILHLENDRGIFDGFNKGLIMSDADIVCMLGADDYFDDNFDFSIVIKKMNLVQIVLPRYKYFHESKTKRNIFYAKYSYWHYFIGIPFYHPGTFIKRQLALKNEFIISNRYKYCADFIYFWRVMQNKPEISSLDNTVFVESGGASGSWGSRVKNLHAMILALPFIVLCIFPFFFLVRYFYKIVQLR